MREYEVYYLNTIPDNIIILQNRSVLKCSPASCRLSPRSWWQHSSTILQTYAT